MVVVILAPLAVIAFLALNKSLQRLASEDPSHNLKAADLILVALPWGPIVGYTILNQNLLYAVDAAIVLMGWLICSAILMLGVPRLLSRWGATPVFVGLTAGLLFSVSNMALLSNAMNWFDQGNLMVQLGMFTLVAGLVTVLFIKDRKFLYALCLMVFVGALFQPPNEHQEISHEGSPIDLVHVEPTKTPDIYFLAYDSYVINETMLGYGIDNQAQEDWLRNAGFKIYPHSYSVGAATLATVGRMFGARRNLQAARSGDAPLINQLEGAGYTTFGVFENGLFFQGNGSHFDNNFPPEGSSALILHLAILEGRFRHNVAYRSPTNEQFNAAKQTAYLSKTKPKLVYTHSGPNHSQNSGLCQADETEQFVERLQRANIEMRNDVATVRSVAEDAIIFVFGDHGPYLTKNCYQLRDNPEQVTRLDLQDRYGAFLAVAAPDDFLDSFDPVVLQDIAPALLSFLYPGQDFSGYQFASHTLTADKVTAGVKVVDGIIQGGVDDGQPLFVR